MNEKEAVQRTVAVLKESLPDDVTVRTEGGGEFMELPCVIISWSTRRLERLEGNIPYAGVKRDENGIAVSEVLNAYFEMRLDLWVKTYDDEPIRMADEPHWGEEGRDELVNMVHETFLPFEMHPSKFHEDTFEWQVGDGLSQSVPTEEPNWFETDQTVKFRYVKEYTNDDVDTLEIIERNVTST
ncbi:hypothetical protein [Natronorubrum sulfidifaciens]|uniref:Uncharacterized protein n=1 Tax=Natronorubrum sulfidifaciens JCM 14089 TaxID=1230460 RepID=L9WCT1_9EURY|nr:hypothetical protein [Natronorubrum sulfidifaciens]ELY47305.1 hypothetical protein C495_03567 [Natronorubrum sulfidifaciens JCM 14089]